MWHRRALVESGFVAPAPVSLSELTASATDAARETWGLVAHVLSIRWLTEPGAPVPLVALTVT